MLVLGLARPDLSQPLGECFRARLKFLLLDNRLLMILVCRDVFRQFRHAQIAEYAKQCPRREASFQVTMHFAQDNQVGRGHHKDQIGLSTDIRVGRQARMRRSRVGRAKQVELSPGMD